MSEQIIIRKAQQADFDGIWPIFHAVVKGGDTYPYDPTISKEDACKLWLSPLKETYVAVLDDEIVGTYYLQANQPGLGAHVANAGYMVHPEKRGYGIGKIIAEHSLTEAKKLGFLAMQFNLVVSTNERAVALWKKVGFQVIGVTPKSFRHAQFGYVDAYIMHQFLATF